MIAVSSKTGENIDVRQIILKKCDRESKEARSLSYSDCPIDRVFMQGFGTVVTGTPSGWCVKNQ